MTLNPHQLERRKSDGRRIPNDLQNAFGVVSSLKLLHDLSGSLVVPEWNPIQHQSSVVVDEDRAMHLAAGGHAGDAVRPLIDLAEDGSDTGCRAFPPGFGTLLGPAKLRDNLIVLSSRKRRCFPGDGNESRTYASSADVNCEQEIFLHRVGGNQT